MLAFLLCPSPARSAEHAVPGDILVFSATSTFVSNGSVYSSDYSCNVIVYSTLVWPRSVFVIGGWRSVELLDGSTAYVFSNHMTDGMLVRGFVWINQDVALINGVQTNSGGIFLDGFVYTQVPGPGYLVKDGLVCKQ